jgi:hypothetical protein
MEDDLSRVCILVHEHEVCDDLHSSHISESCTILEHSLIRLEIQIDPSCALHDTFNSVLPDLRADDPFLIQYVEEILKWHFDVFDCKT